MRKKVSKSKQLAKTPPKSVKGGHTKARQESIKIQAEIIKLVQENYTHKDIVEKLAKKYRKKEPTIKAQYTAAMKLIRESHEREVGEIKNEFLEGLYKDLREAYQNYLKIENNGVSLKWFETYLAIKKEIRGFYELKEKDQVNNGTIIINIDKDDAGL